MSEYHVEFEELDLHWIVYEVFPDKEVSVEIMRNDFPKDQIRLGSAENHSLILSD